MSGTIRRRGRLLAILAVVLQVVLQGQMPLGHASGADLAGTLCAPSGKAPSAEALAAAKVFGDLRDDGDGDTSGAGAHCPLCALTHGTPLPLPIVLAVPRGVAGKTRFISFEPQFAHFPQGPPLGSRAPPLHA